MATLQPMTPLQPLMQASMKPPSPLHAPEQRPLKPPSPLQPKNAPKTPISQPQRRRRFQLRLGRRPQRRRRFQPHTGTSAQRRWRFQTTGPPGRQSQAAVPVGGGWASPQHPWAISVTNVVKPEQFEPPCECSCYKRRQSASKNLDFQRKSRRIDDVCNNTQRSAPRYQHDKPDHIGGSGETGCSARGRRLGLAGLRADAPSHTPAHQAPLVWRAPEGPEGTGGLRGAAPNEVKTPSLAGGRAIRRPEHPWRRNKQQATSNAYKNAHPEPGRRI